MTIGQRIAKCRKEKNLSQEYIAEMLEVSRQAVSKWECDLTEPDTGNLIALSNLFGVSVEYLAKGETVEKAVLVERSLPTLKIIGIILIALGGLSCIMGVITPLMLSVGAIAIFFGIFILLLQKEGLILGISTAVLAITLFLVQGFTGGVDTPIMLLILSISVTLPLIIYGIVKLAKKLKSGELPKIDDIKKSISKKSITITIVVILGIIAAIISGILVASAREKSFKKATWFSNEYLSECNLEGVPRIGGEYKAKIGESKIFVEMKSQENFEMYVRDHFLGMYLNECSFRHIGTRGSIISCNSGSIVYELVPGEDIADFRLSHGKYVFVISNTRGNSGEVEATIISLEWVGDQKMIVEGKAISYNVIMSIYPESHTESYALRSAAAYGITYEGDSSIYYGVPPITAIANMNVTVKVNALDGAYVALYANGMSIKKTYECDKYSEFSFIMPSQNVVITAEIVGDESNAPSVNSLRYYEGWLTDLTADDIARVKISQWYSRELDDSPFVYVQSTTHKDVIASILGDYQRLRVDITSEGWLPEEGAGGLTATFVLSDGSVREINFVSGHYRMDENTYFSVSVIPSLMPYDNENVIDSFSLRLESDSYVACKTGGGETVTVYGLEELEFTDYREHVDYKMSDCLYYVETETGTIYIYNDTVFGLVCESFHEQKYCSVTYGGFYQILGMSVE